MIKIVSGLLLGVSLSVAAAQQIKSPDGKIVVKVTSGEQLKYEVRFRGRTVVEPSNLGISIDGSDLGLNASFAGEVQTTRINESYPMLGAHKKAVDSCKLVVIPLQSGNVPWQLEVRVFNDGVAYRYRVPETGRHHIDGEDSQWMLPVGTMIWHQSADNRSYEARYISDIVGQMGTHQQIMAPSALKFPDDVGYGLMTEANLVSYSDMALYSSGTNGFKAVFHDATGGWDETGEIISPWRVTLLAPDLNAMVNSDIIKNLCPPSPPELANASWIKPGRSAWGWLSCYCGPKLEEQKTWVDNTKALGFEYYLVDDGWRTWNGGGDNAWDALADLVKYANSRGVSIWAWVNAKYVHTAADRQAYFQHAQKIGLAGLKVDFPDAANPEWVQWYEDVLRDAAALHLMIDFHGAVKPTGRERTWPNEITREAIAGREQGKNPATHDTTLPFLRYVQGHADYTPTLFISNRLNGSSLAHELAMAVVFTSPFLCFGDDPKHYIDSPAADIIKALPCVWDETVVLPGSEIGERAVFARRHGDDWFIGAINGQTPWRDTVPLRYLGAGNYRLVELADDPENNDALVRTERMVTAKDVLTLPLRKDGGYVCWLSRIGQ